MMKALDEMTIPGQWFPSGPPLALLPPGLNLS